MQDNNTNADDSTEPTTDHPAHDLETIVVDPDDVIEMMRRNKRDEDQQRSHVLRVTPPLEGERTASLYVSQEGNFYPPEMTPKPIHLSERHIFEGRRDAQLENQLRHPDYGSEKAYFCDEHGVEAAGGPPEELEDKWDEWWNEILNVWESHIQAAMREPREIQLGGYFAEEPETTVEVRFEGGDG